MDSWINGHRADGLRHPGQDVSTLVLMDSWING